MDVGSIGDFDEIEEDKELNEDLIDFRAPEARKVEHLQQSKQIRFNSRFRQPTGFEHEESDVREIDRIKQSRLGISSFIIPEQQDTPQKIQVMRNSSLSDSLLVEHKINPRKDNKRCSCAMI